MKLYKVVEGLKQFFVYDGQEVIVTSNSVTVGDKAYESDVDDYYWVWNGVLTKEKPSRQDIAPYVYNENKFEQEHGYYALANYHLGRNIYYSSVSVDGIKKIALSSNGERFLFEIASEGDSNTPHYSISHDIVIFSSDRSLLFYTKTGQCLWEYKEEEVNLKVNAGCISIVDDVVVVISMKGNNPKKIQGFNIKSGKRIWETNMDNGVANTLFVGPDKMLYGCKSVWIEPFVSSKLILTKLNPLTGELQQTTICEGECFDVMPWLVTMHGNKLYYTDNRRGNEIGVIDVEKKELVERMPLNIEKKVTIGAPVVTDDKVYVFIEDLQELRVYEK